MGAKCLLILFQLPDTNFKICHWRAFHVSCSEDVARLLWKCWLTAWCRGFWEECAGQFKAENQICVTPPWERACHLLYKINTVTSHLLYKSKSEPDLYSFVYKCIFLSYQYIIIWLLFIVTIMTGVLHYCCFGHVRSTSNQIAPDLKGSQAVTGGRVEGRGMDE